MIFDILEITDCFKIKGLLLTVDIEKAFDSVDHQFLINFGCKKELSKMNNEETNNYQRNKNKVFKIRKSCTARTSNICLSIDFSVRSSICSDQIKSKH